MYIIDLQLLVVVLFFSMWLLLRQLRLLRLRLLRLRLLRLLRLRLLRFLWFLWFRTLVVLCRVLVGLGYHRLLLQCLLQNDSAIVITPREARADARPGDRSGLAVRAGGKTELFTTV